MKRRITIHASAPSPTPLSAPSPFPVEAEVGHDFFRAPPGSTLLSESGAVARGLFLALTALGFAIAKMILVSWQETLLVTLTFIVPIAIMISALIWACLTIYRAFWFERRERRFIQFLDAHLEALLAEPEAAPREAAPSPPRPRDTDFWNRLAFTVLERYYTTLARTGSREEAARAISRDACVRDGVCNQKEWNVLNKLFQTRGLRAGRKRGLIPATLEEAWSLWTRHTVRSWRIDEDGDWIPQE